MIRYREVIDGEVCQLNVVETTEDYPEVLKFARLRNKKGKRYRLALDTESTGLNTHHPDWRLRLFQFGDAKTVFIIPVMNTTLMEEVLEIPRVWVGHNIPHDIRSIDRHLGRETGLLPKCHDTFILAHLLDSRKMDEGGLGHRLESLSIQHIDPSIIRFEQNLKAEFKKIEIPVPGKFYQSGPKKGLPKVRKALLAEGWSRISIWNEAYLRYAGADPLLTLRLYRYLRQEMIGAYPHEPGAAEYLEELGCTSLEHFERRVQRACDRLQRKGVLVDVPYVTHLARDMIADVQRHQAEAAKLGVSNVNSTPQLADALVRHGAQLTERTKTGKLKVDVAVLTPLRKAEGDLGTLVEHVFQAKQKAKRKVAYLDAMLTERDENDRAHATIRALAARTARMSISDIPFHQLPSNEKRIRQSIIAPKGWHIFSVDYDQQEMRMAGALSGEERIIEAAKTGFSIHKLTAETVFGPEYTPQEYKFSKNLNFGWLFGGGANTLSRQTGIELEAASQLIRRYSAAYPTMNAWKKELTDLVIRRALTKREFSEFDLYRSRMWTTDDKALKHVLRRSIDKLLYGKMGYVVTPIGRRLWVEASKAYRAVNYLIQSSSRDITAAGLIRITDSRYGKYGLLVIHDEILGEAPRKKAPRIAETFAEMMTTEFRGVPITASGKVYGPSWGDGYGD